MKPRAALKKKIEEQVFPHLKKLGFSEKPSREKALSGVSKTTYPYGTWTRKNADSSIDLIEFKFDKMGRASFEFDFAQIKKEGGFGTYQWISQKDAVANGVGEYGRYRPKMLTTSNPTSLSFSSKIVSNPNNIHQVMKSWLDGLDQVEDWFQSRQVGPYIVTFENVPRGVCISRGFSEYIIFKQTSLMFAGSTRDRFFEESNVESLAEARSEAEKYYDDMGRKLDLSRWFFWQTHVV